MSTHLFVSRELGRYGFPEGHPLSVDRQGAFWRAACSRGLNRKVTLAEGALASREAISRFHSPHYIDRVMEASRRGSGYLDYGDTPAFAGCYEVGAHVIGAALEGARRIVSGEAGSTASASAGKTSVTRLIQRICKGSSGSGKPAMIAAKITSTSLRLSENNKCTNLIILA